MCTPARVAHFTAASRPRERRRHRPGPRGPAPRPRRGPLTRPTAGPNQPPGAPVNPAVPTWAGVAASLALVALAVAIAWRQRLRLAREIIIAAVRAGAQLTAVGAVLLLVFARAGLAGAFGWLAVMVLIAGQVAARRA